MKTCNHQHLLLFVILSVAAYGRKLDQNFPLLEFREISNVKLIIDYKTIELPVTQNIDDTFGTLTQDLVKLQCETDICNAEKRILIDDILRKNSTLKNIGKYKEEVNFTRKKREWPAWGNFLKWSGGVMNEEDRQVLHNYLMKLYVNQSKINDQIEKLELKVDQTANKSDVELLKRQNDLKQLREIVLIQSLKHKFDRASIFSEAILSSYINGYVHGALIDDKILNNLDNVINPLSKNRQLMCKSSLDCIRSANSKIKYTDGCYFISVTLPILSTKTFKLINVLSTPGVLSNFALVMRPKHKNFILDNEELVAVNENFLSHCIENDSDLLFCRAEDVISSINKFDCLFKAVYDKKVDFKACGNSMELFELESRGVIKLDKGTFWIYSQTPSEIEIKCDAKELESRNITGSEVLMLKIGCQAKFENMVLTSFSHKAKAFLKSFQASISIEDFKEVIDRMETFDLSEIIPYDLLLGFPSGLKEKQKNTHEGSWQVKNQWQENEIKTLHAEHNQAIIIALVITIAALLFFVLRKNKSIFVITSEDKELNSQNSAPECNDHLKDSESVSNLSVYWKSNKN